MTPIVWTLRVALLLGLLLGHASPAAGAGIDGVWRGIVDGESTVLTLQADGGNVTGVYGEGALRLDIRGTLDGQRLQATVREPNSGLDIARIGASLSGDNLQAQIDAEHPHTGVKKSARATFRRDGAGAPTGDVATSVPGALDRELIGTWLNEKMINSGGANFASFTTVMTMTLGADGRVQQWSRSVGGGGNWNYDSGAGELQYAGRWSAQDGLLYVQLDGAAGFKPIARYRFSDAYLVTENDAGRLIWQRR